MLAVTRAPSCRATKRQAFSPLEPLAGMIHVPAIDAGAAVDAGGADEAGVALNGYTVRVPRRYSPVRRPGSTERSSVAPYWANVRTTPPSRGRLAVDVMRRSPLKKAATGAPPFVAISKRNGISRPLTVTAASHLPSRCDTGGAAASGPVAASASSAAAARRVFDRIFMACSSRNRMEKEKGPEGCCPPGLDLRT